MMSEGEEALRLLPELTLLLGAVGALLLGLWTPQQQQWRVRLLVAIACLVSAGTAAPALGGPDFDKGEADGAPASLRVAFLLAGAAHRRRSEWIAGVAADRRGRPTGDPSWLRPGLEAFLEPRQVGRHLLRRLAADHQRHQHRTDAVPGEVHRDRDHRPLGAQRLDGHVDRGPDRPVQAADRPARGGSRRTSSEVEARSAPPIRRTVTQRAPTPVPPSMWPLTTPACHSANRDGSVT